MDTTDAGTERLRRLTRRAGPALVGSLAGPVYLALLLAALPLLAGSALPVLLDGSFAEWRGEVPVENDAAGDGRAGGVDLRRLFLANDSDALYLQLEVGDETILQNSLDEPAGNHLRLYLDLDNSRATGLPFEGLGVEVEIRFGERQVVTYDPAGVGTLVVAGSLGHEALPTHSAEVFEIRVPFDAAPSTALADRLRAGAELGLVLREEAAGGDRLPDAGRVEYETSTEAVAKPRPIALAKRRARWVRLLTFNVERSTIAARPEVFRRILRAVRPDVIAFQEIYTWSAEETRRFVADAVPAGRRGEWEASQNADTVTVSVYPIVAAAGIDGNLVTLLDLPDQRTPYDLVLFNAHTPCCQNEAGRDYEHDRLAATWRDLLAGTGPFGIQPLDAVIFTGDFNMVGFRRQLEVLRDGVFIDPAHGPDFAPGRRKGSLRDALPRHESARLTHTWRSEDSPFTPGRLDYVLYSRDVARWKSGYVLDTATLSESALAETGLEAGDSFAASDHLAVVSDFAFRRK